LAVLKIADGNSTTVQQLKLTGSTGTGNVTGGADPITGALSTLEVTTTLVWDWGNVTAAIVKVSSAGGQPAKMLVQANPNPAAPRNLVGSVLTILGNATVTADLNVLSGSRIKVDGTNGAGTFAVQFASVKTDTGLPLWAVSGATLSFSGDVDGSGNPTSDIELPVVVDGSTLGSTNFWLKAGLLQRGTSAATFSGSNRVWGQAPTNEGPGFNLYPEAVYVAGGLLRLSGANQQFWADRDMVIKPAAALDAEGTIWLGDVLTGYDSTLDIEGLLTVKDDDEDEDDPYKVGNLTIDGYLVLSGTTRITVNDGVADRITVTGDIYLGGALDVVPGNNPPAGDQTWTVFSAGARTMVT
jgi:hypothetical protein